MTPEAHKSAAADGSYSRVTTENGEQQDVWNLTIIPCVQPSLFLKEVPTIPAAHKSNSEKELIVKPKNAGTLHGRARVKKRSRARKEASAQEVRGHYKQFAEASHLKWKSCIDNEVFDFVDLRNVRPKNCVTRTMGTLGNFLREN